jgi:hypothetical protein
MAIAENFAREVAVFADIPDKIVQHLYTGGILVALLRNVLSLACFGVVNTFFAKGRDVNVVQRVLGNKFRIHIFSYSYNFHKVTNNFYKIKGVP